LLGLRRGQSHSVANKRIDYFVQSGDRGHGGLLANPQGTNVLSTP
jgi:hypothetical protein